MAENNEEGIVAGLAAMDPWMPVDGGNDLACFFCGGMKGREHYDECLWCRAVKAREGFEGGP
jgi:hypothetical protein